MSFSSGKLSLAAATVALAACAALPSAASAETQAVTGTVISASLAIGTITPATFAGLGTAAGYDTTGGTVGLIAIGPWVARISDLGATSVGKLTAATPGSGSCASSTTTLNNALGVSSTGSLGNFVPAAPVTLSAAAQQIASGNGSNVMTVAYHHTTSASDQLMPGCAYGLTSTVALAAG